MKTARGELLEDTNDDHSRESRAAMLIVLIAEMPLLNSRSYFVFFNLAEIAPWESEDTHKREISWLWGGNVEFNSLDAYLLGTPGCAYAATAGNCEAIIVGPMGIWRGLCHTLMSTSHSPRSWAVGVTWTTMDCSQNKQDLDRIGPRKPTTDGLRQRGHRKLRVTK